MIFRFDPRPTIRARTRLAVAVAVALFATVAGAARGEVHDPATVSTIAFGSCVHQDHPQEIWSEVLATRPDVFVFLGDNIYGDTEDMDELRAKYAMLGAKPGFAELKRRGTRILATWDDHDYGRDDAGREYPKKVESREIFLDFFGVPADSPRRSRDGVYGAHAFGPPERRIQILLLDSRYNRSGLRRGPKPANELLGSYVPNDSPNATMLGDAQWAWLEARLREPAVLRIVCCSIPFVPEFTGHETWANMPRERRRLIDLIDATGAEGVVFVSGDTHWAELSRLDREGKYPLFDLTSSGMTETWIGAAPNVHRIGEACTDANFGTIRVRWDAAPPEVVLEIRDGSGAVRVERAVGLDELRAR